MGNGKVTKWEKRYEWNDADPLAQCADNQFSWDAIEALRQAVNKLEAAQAAAPDDEPTAEMVAAREEIERLRAALKSADAENIELGTKLFYTYTGEDVQFLVAEKSDVTAERDALRERCKRLAAVARAGWAYYGQTGGVTGLHDALCALWPGDLEDTPTATPDADEASRPSRRWIAVKDWPPASLGRGTDYWVYIPGRRGAAGRGDGPVSVDHGEWQFECIHPRVDSGYVSHYMPYYTPEPPEATP